MADPDPGGSALIVYVDRSDIRDGRLEALESAIPPLVGFIESQEPQLVSYGFHLDEEAGLMTVVAVHPDSASLERHMAIGGPEFRKLGDMIVLRQIEVFGSVSDRAREMLAQKAAMLGDGGVTVHERFAGFAHPLSAEAS